MINTRAPDGANKEKSVFEEKLPKQIPLSHGSFPLAIRNSDFNNIFRNFFSVFIFDDWCRP